MGRAIWSFVSLGCFALGIAGMSITYYAWFGAWPAEMKEIVDYQRSLGERGGHDTDPVLQSVRSRTTSSLNGTWRAVIDPYARGDLAGIAARVVEPETASDLAEFSFQNGLQLQVPGDWNTQDPRLVFYQGVQDYWNLKGLADDDGRRKAAFD